MESKIKAIREAIDAGKYPIIRPAMFGAWQILHVANNRADVIADGFASYREALEALNAAQGF